MVVKVERTADGLMLGSPNDIQLRSLAKKFPEYFQPVRPGQITRMVADTKRQREFLVRFGGDTNVFTPKKLKLQP